MAALPSGTVTFLFTDVEGSTRRWEEHPDRMPAAMARHDELLRTAVELRNGYVVKATGDGLLAAFATAEGALQAAIDAQRALGAEDWELAEPIRARVGIHTGPAEQRDGDYFGSTLNRAARLMSLGHGGQVLLSQTAYDLVRDALPDGVTLLDVGEHRMKDLLRAERVHQVVAPGLATEFPTLRSLDRRRHNLPVERSALIGRERELAGARERLLAAETGLLTLTGPGGTGKTRLALQLAAEVVDDFEHGVLLVELAPITDPGLVLGAIAQVLGVKEEGGRPLSEVVAQYVAGKSLLLVLDNFEQVLEGASTVGELLRAAPKLKVLATSRAPLRIRGEREYPVPPLAMPERGKALSLERLSQYEAVRLFVQRAQDARPDFQVTNDNAPAVAEICHRLDGLPLAIELAAARVKVLPPQVLLERLDRRLPVLTGGARDLPGRQQTLRKAIAWSHDLLDDGERALFRRLGVFVGGCTLEAAEAVCGAGPVGDMLDALSALVDKSLLRQEENGGEPRFLMLETIREFASERLQESGEAEATQTRHAEVCVALVEEFQPRMVYLPEAQAWRRRVEPEVDNLRAAIAWASAAPDRGELALRLTMGAAWFGGGRGQFEYHRRLVALLPAVTTSPWRRAWALSHAGWAETWLGDLRSAQAYNEESLGIFRGLEDDFGVAWQLNLLAVDEMERGDHDAARAHYEESLAIWRRLGDSRWVAGLLNNLGALAMKRQDMVRARAYYEEALATGRQLGAPAMMRFQLSGLGDLAREAGDLRAARAAYEEALAIARDLEDPSAIAGGLHNLGHTLLRQSEPEPAIALFRESLALWQGLHREFDAARAIALGLAGAACHAAWVRRPARGARLVAAARTLLPPGRPVDRVDQAEHDHALEAIRAALTEDAFAEAWAEGEAMTLDEAVAYALRDAD